MLINCTTTKTYISVFWHDLPCFLALFLAEETHHDCNNKSIKNKK